VASPNDRNFAHKILLIIGASIIFIIISYTVYQLYNVRTNGYGGIDRIIEIAVTWTSRVLGFFIGYWFTKQNLEGTAS